MSTGWPTIRSNSALSLVVDVAAGKTLGGCADKGPLSQHMASSATTSIRRACLFIVATFVGSVDLRG